jgi:hypothetical protein
MSAVIALLIAVPLLDCVLKFYARLLLAAFNRFHHRYRIVRRDP